MIEQGGLLTEFLTRTNADKINFVRRNRIVASFQSCFVHAKELMKWSGNLDTYYESLIKMMAFGIVGVLAFGFTEIQGQRKKYKMKKM